MIFTCHTSIQKLISIHTIELEDTYISAKFKMYHENNFMQYENEVFNGLSCDVCHRWSCNLSAMDLEQSYKSHLDIQYVTEKSDVKHQFGDMANLDSLDLKGGK